MLQSLSPESEAITTLPFLATSAQRISPIASCSYTFSLTLSRRIFLSPWSIISEYMPELFNTGFEYPWSNEYFATALFESRIVKLVGVKTPSLLFIFFTTTFCDESRL